MALAARDNTFPGTRLVMNIISSGDKEDKQATLRFPLKTMFMTYLVPGQVSSRAESATLKPTLLYTVPSSLLMGQSSVSLSLSLTLSLSRSRALARALSLSRSLSLARSLNLSSLTHTWVFS